MAIRANRGVSPFFWSLMILLIASMGPVKTISSMISLLVCSSIVYLFWMFCSSSNFILSICLSSVLEFF